jgi:hypothetical protein
LALAGLLGAVPGSMAAANANDPNDVVATAEVPEEQAAAERYVVQLRTLLETSIVPGLRRGILLVAATRPPKLTVEVSDDPSPYNVGAEFNVDGTFTVRLSLGYMTMHDAALDAVALSAVLRNPGSLRRYLIYQLQVARENYWHRAVGATPRHAMTFAEYIGLDRLAVQAIYSRGDWRESRNRVEAESLGWAIAYLLVRADSRLGGALPLASDQPGTATARLAAASGWFPVPPFATALHLAEVTRGPAEALDERALLCRATLLMENGIAGLNADANWRERLERDAVLQGRVTEIRTQIAAVRHDSECVSAEVIT